MKYLEKGIICIECKKKNDVRISEDTFCLFLNCSFQMWSKDYPNVFWNISEDAKLQIVLGRCMDRNLCGSRYLIPLDFWNCATGQSGENYKLIIEGMSKTT